MKLPTIVRGEIKNRAGFAGLANRRNLTYAVEVGVNRAEFARRFLADWRGRTFVGVDPYLSGSTEYGDPKHPREPDYAIAVRSLAKDHRARLLKLRGTDAADHLRGEPVDFVFLAAEVSATVLGENLAAWWDLLAPRGILAGAAYDPDRPGVIVAVDRFAANRELVIYTTGDVRGRCWWFEKRDEWLETQRRRIHAEAGSIGSDCEP